MRLLTWKLNKSVMIIYEIGWNPAASAKMHIHIASTGSQPGSQVPVEVM